MSDRSQMLLDAMAHEFPRGPGGNLAALDELGAYEGPDIPRGLWEMQQWAGQTPALRNIAGPAVNVPLVRINLPHKYTRDFTIHFACPAPRGPGAFDNAGFTSTSRVTLRWGHNGAFEEVDLTWPARGGSVTVHASTLEVLYNDTSAVNNAAVCWVDSGRASRTAEGYKPCLVTLIGTMEYGGASGIQVVSLARRTRSYALAWAYQLGVTGIAQAIQQEANANPLGQTWHTDNIVDNVNGVNMSKEVPVHHWATELQISNFSTTMETDLINVTLLQYLDLG
jgi:hypothetical protein